MRAEKASLAKWQSIKYKSIPLSTPGKWNCFIALNSWAHIEEQSRVLSKTRYLQRLLNFVYIIGGSRRDRCYDLSRRPKHFGSENNSPINLEALQVPRANEFHSLPLTRISDSCFDRFASACLSLWPTESTVLPQGRKASTNLEVVTEYSPFPKLVILLTEALTTLPSKKNHFHNQKSIYTIKSQHGLRYRFRPLRNQMFYLPNQIPLDVNFRQHVSTQRRPRKLEFALNEVRKYLLFAALGDTF